MHQMGRSDNLRWDSRVSQRHKLIFTLWDPGHRQEEFGESSVGKARLGDSHLHLRQETDLWAALKMGALELTLSSPAVSSPLSLFHSLE